MRRVLDRDPQDLLRAPFQARHWRAVRRALLDIHPALPFLARYASQRGAYPWTVRIDTPLGRVRVMSSPDTDDVRTFSTDVFELEIPAGGKSGRRWQMADEVFYALSGSGYCLQWEVQAEIEAGLAPNAFPIGDKTTMKQLAEADPWKGFFEQGNVLKRG